MTRVRIEYAEHSGHHGDISISMLPHEDPRNKQNRGQREPPAFCSGIKRYRRSTDRVAETKPERRLGETHNQAGPSRCRFDGCFRLRRRFVGIPNLIHVSASQSGVRRLARQEFASS